MHAEVIGTPSEAEGITVAVGLPGLPATGVVRVEYPMRMVDPYMVNLIQRLHASSDRLTVY